MFDLFHNDEAACLMAAFLLSTCFCISSGVPTNNAGIAVNQNTVPPELVVPQGTIRGVNMVTHYGRRIFGFNGIPYALPPVGNLRFKPPEPPKAWTGTLNATNDAVYCPQVDENRFIGNEDCLYLHIYTPRLPPCTNSTLLPVMFFVSGGRFKQGHSNPSQWGPEYLLDKDVVLVVPSYRVGVLGFLSTGDEVAPGNNGLKDIVQALKWNRDNIKYFGGDPSRVTLFGSSSGAMSVHLLTLSRSTTGLFQRYITNSGSALTWVTRRPRKVLVDYSTRLAKYLGCPTNASRALVDCLMGLNASRIIDTDALFIEWDFFPQIIWGPTIEPDIQGALITENSFNLINSGRIRDLPWLSSVNRNEGIIYAALFYQRPDVFEEFLNNIDAILPHISQYNDVVDNVTAYTASLKSYYLNDLTADRNLLLRNFTQLVGDMAFVYPAYSALQKHFISARNPQYFCSIEYRGTFSHTYKYTGGSTKDWGVCHADGMIYLFPNSVFALGPPGSRMNEADREMIDTMVQLWTSFAITGRPSTETMNTSVTWEPYSSRKNYLRIGNNSDPSISVGYNYAEERMQFLERLSSPTS